MGNYQLMQKMNAGYKYAFINVKTNKILSIHKEWEKAQAKLERTASYQYLKSLVDNPPANFDELVTHDVVSIYDLVFKQDGTEL